MPPIADAVKVPHANPEIGVIAPDKNLGLYERYFVNTICLIEEREPGGKSDNTGKMLNNLDKDNDNSVKGKEFLRARMLDMFLGDWDDMRTNGDGIIRTPEKINDMRPFPVTGTRYFMLPRDDCPNWPLDPYILPTLQNFSGKMEHPEYSLY